MQQTMAVIAVASLLAACSTSPNSARHAPPIDPSASAALEPKPRREAPSRFGNPETYEVFGKRYRVLDSSQGFRQRGLASWYGPKFHGRRTSSGERFDMHAISAAHKRLPLPTYARVTRLDNGRSIVVKINDRGPFKDARIIDLSYAAARKLGIVEHGVAPVEVTALEPYQYLRRRPAEFETPRAALRSAAPSPPRTDVYLQVGAFSRLDTAERLQLRVRRTLGRDALVDSSSALHKVRIGPLRDSAEIAAITSQLAALGLEPPRLINR